MSAWLLQIAAIIILTAAVGLILPQGKTAKAVKSALAAITLFVIIAPIKDIIVKSDVSYSFAFDNLEYDIDIAYIELINTQKCKAMQKEIENTLTKNDFAGVTCVVYADTSQVEFTAKQIELKLNNLVILEKHKHIDINVEITKLVAAIAKIDSQKVIIYG